MLGILFTFWGLGFLILMKKGSFFLPGVMCTIECPFEKSTALSNLACSACTAGPSAGEGQIRNRARVLGPFRSLGWWVHNLGDVYSTSL